MASEEDETPTVGIESIDLPYYATYSKQPTGGRVVLPTEHQIRYTRDLPWEKQKELGEMHSDMRITATNKVKPRSVDIDLEEDEGAYATYIPVCYQLPPSDEVIRNKINSREINEISDKLDELKVDISKSIGKLMRNSVHCRLCNIFSTEESPSHMDCSNHTFHGKEAKAFYKPHANYNPEMDFESDMKKLMRPRDPLAYRNACWYYTPALGKSEGDDWQGSNPIRKVQDEINKKAVGMRIDSPWKKSERDRFRKALDLPLPYPDVEDELPWRLSPLPRYRNTRYPTDHLVTRRKGYKFIS